ncbi:MAG: hypothetical protein AAGG00_04230 [Cyanobacteria bacterium P01_H01_bin.150]
MLCSTFTIIRLPKIIAANAFQGTELVNQAAGMADDIASGFDDLWQETINNGTGTPSGIWIAMCSVGILFAVATLSFFMVEWVKNTLDGDEKRSYTEFIWVIIVITLLTNNGFFLGKTTFSIRNYINNVNSFVLENAAATYDLRANFQSVLGAQAARISMGNAIANCQQQASNPQNIVVCLEETKEDFQNAYPELFNKSGAGVPGPLNDIVQKIDRVLSSTGDAIKNGANPLEIITSPINAIIGSDIMQFVTIIMLALNGAYQWAIELSFLLTAIMAPLAVGGSLLPFGTKPIFVWLTGFFSIGMAKLSFNIIVGFAGQLMATSRASQPLFFLFTIAIFAPFLATGIAAGGGLAVLSQINRASMLYTNLAIKVSSMVLTKGFDGAARRIGGAE